MNEKRIIPCLDIDKNRVVKGRKFQNVQDVADPIELAKKYDADGANELVFYDITATNEQRSIFLDLMKKINDSISIPLMVGGGIRTIQDIDTVLNAGAEKVSINSAALTNPELIEQAAKEFGSKRIVLSLDAKQVANGKWNVFANGGRVDTKIEAIDWAIKMEQLGAGEIVVNSIDADGEKNGYDLPLTTAIAKAVQIPIVASGGAGKKEHFQEALQHDNITAALAASVFHYDEINIRNLKQYLAANNIPIKE